MLINHFYILSLYTKLTVFYIAQFYNSFKYISFIFFYIAVTPPWACRRTSHHWCWPTKSPPGCPVEIRTGDLRQARALRGAMYFRPQPIFPRKTSIGSAFRHWDVKGTHRPRTRRPRNTSSKGRNIQDFSFGDTSFGDKSFGDTSFGDASFGDTSFGDTSFGDTSFGDKSVGDTLWRHQLRNTSRFSSLIRWKWRGNKQIDSSKLFLCRIFCGWKCSLL